MRWIPYITGASLAFACWGLWGQLQVEREAVARLERERELAQVRAAQHVHALTVAQAVAEENAEAAAELAAVRNWINGEETDAPLPDLLRDLFDRVYAPR